jgi:hypothetical protein
VQFSGDVLKAMQRGALLGGAGPLEYAAEIPGHANLLVNYSNPYGPETMTAALKALSVAEGPPAFKQFQQVVKGFGDLTGKLPHKEKGTDVGLEVREAAAEHFKSLAQLQLPRTYINANQERVTSRDFLGEALARLAGGQQAMAAGSVGAQVRKALSGPLMYINMSPAPGARQAAAAAARFHESNWARCYGGEEEAPPPELANACCTSQWVSQQVAETPPVSCC